jgi:hypothetical protein
MPRQNAGRSRFGRIFSEIVTAVSIVGSSSFGADAAFYAPNAGLQAKSSS